jgi:hypothetical protein
LRNRSASPAAFASVIASASESGTGCGCRITAGDDCRSPVGALVPHLGCGDLEIGGGLLASLAYEELRNPSTSANRAAELRANLLAYCRRDTEAMLELFRALR